MQLITGIAREFQKLLKYFNGAVIVKFLKIPLSPSASVFIDNLALYLKDLKLVSFAISALKLVASSSE